MAGIEIDGVNNKIELNTGAAAADQHILFNGNAQDFYIALDDSADDLLIGLGSTVGTTPIISVDENKDVNIPDGTLTISNTGNEKTLNLISTDADASHGPYIRMFRNSSSAADEDLVGRIDFANTNDADEEENYLMMYSRIEDASNGNESGKFYLDTMVNGTTRSRIYMKKDLTVFNEDSQDIDFRIESDSQANMFNLQAAHASNSAGTIGFNSANSDGNFFEAVNPQTGVYTGKMIASPGSGGVYTLGLTISGYSPDDNSSAFIVGNDATTVRFRVYSDGDVQNHDNSYGSTSDERIKSNIVDANSQWDDIKALKIRNYKKNDDIAQYGDKAWVQLGVIAQELEAAGMDKCVKKEVLYTAEDQEVAINKTAKEGDIKDYKVVKYSILYMKAIKALQEAQTRIETLETKVAALEG